MTSYYVTSDTTPPIQLTGWCYEMSTTYIYRITKLIYRYIQIYFQCSLPNFQKSKYATTLS